MYSEDEIKRVAERIENQRIKEEFCLLEKKEGFVQERFSILDKNKFFLEFLGEVTIGITVGIISLIANYFVFVRLLHVEF